MNNEKYVSVVIPIFNEKKYIRQLLNSLLNQDYPKDRFEILLIDGRSEDGTREEIREVMAASPEFSHLSILVFDNPDRIVPCAEILWEDYGGRILKTGNGWFIQKR